MKYLRVSKASALSEGAPLAVEAGGKAILLVRAGGDIYAVDETCTHEEASLAGGFLEGTTIECPRHGAVFDLKSGHALTLPAYRDLASYPVRLEGEDILVGLEI
ncbi:MAG: non-heme iron oxygenase ferredoxin subunit [Candidatus Glassbacteria bacterium]|nr:non-heme iron oxygenase ferredoxin subunit [Candidatus Glassbacteria bacterium]